MTDVVGAPREVEKDGQVLKHTTATESRKRKRRIMRPAPESEESDPVEERMRTIVDRHTGEPEAEGADSEPDEVPEVEFVSESGESMPPPMEPRPELRSEMTVEEPELVTESQPPRTFEDLMGFDLGDRYHVHVVRKEPKAYGGTRCDGEQKPIRRKMKSEQFARTYGGLKYELTLYGPPKRGPQFDPMSGGPITRALTKPITVTMPGSPPNLQMAIGYNEDEDEEDMTQGAAAAGYTRTRPGIANNADARIHETDLEHERHMEERREQRRQQSEARQQREEQERRRTEVTSADAMARMHETSMESQRDIYKHMSSQQSSILQQMAQGRPGAGAEEQRYLHEALERVQTTNQDYINKLNDSHRAQIERTQTQHQAELARLDTQQRAELVRLQDQVVAERGRSEQIVRDAERAFNDRARESEKRSDRDVSEARREATDRLDNARRDFDQRLADINQRHTERHQDLKDAQERELKARDAKWEMQLTSERSSFDSRMAVKDHELQLAREEIARLRVENDKPIHERVREITETAEALGMRKADGSDAEPDTWQTMLFRMGGDIVQQLPQIISSAGESVARLRQGGTPAQQAAYVRQQQANMGAAAASHPAAAAAMSQQGPLPFALEGEDDFQPLASAPLAYPPQATYQPAEPAVQQPAQPMYQATPSAPPPAAAAPVTQAPSQPPQAAPQPQLEVAPQAAPDPAMDTYILQYREPFEQAMASGAKPDELAAHLSKSFPAPMMSEVIKMVSPQIIRTVLQRNNFGDSPLCRRTGQSYLRNVQAELQKILRG
jgi:hypothetical protein